MKKLFLLASFVVGVVFSTTGSAGFDYTRCRCVAPYPQWMIMGCCPAPGYYNGLNNTGTATCTGAELSAVMSGVILK